MKSSIIYYPLETSYLREVIDDFLTVYNTVSVQKCKDCYVLKLENEVKGKEQVM